MFKSTPMTSIIGQGHPSSNLTKTLLRYIHGISLGPKQNVIGQTDWRTDGQTGQSNSRVGYTQPAQKPLVIQPNPSYHMLLMSSQRSFMQKERKSYWSVSEISPSPLKVDAANTDDGWVGIWKAPLPDGTAELKISPGFPEMKAGYIIRSWNHFYLVYSLASNCACSCTCAIRD